MKYIMSNIIFCFIFLNINSQVLCESNIQKDSFVLLKENCSFGSFNFCYDGYGQLFRGAPLFIIYDSIDPINNYTKAVFEIAPFDFFQKLNQNESKSFSRNNIDSLLSSNNSNNTLKIYSRNLKNRLMNSSLRRITKSKYDGLLYYDIYAAKISYCYQGKKDIYIPNIDRINTKNKNNIIKLVQVDFYYIIDASLW